MNGYRHYGITSFLICILLPASLFLFIQCQSNSNGQKINNRSKDTIPKIKADLSVPGNFSSQTQIQFDSAEIHKFLYDHPLFTAYSNDLFQFYRSRNFTYAWFDFKGLIEPAENLYNKLESIHETGLPVKIPYETELRRIMENDSNRSFKKSANPFLELMLTAEYFFYARVIWSGLGSSGMKAVEWDLPRKKIAYDQLLDSLLKTRSENFLQSEPVYPQYALLKTQLRYYRNIQQQGGWPELIPDKRAYRKSDSSGFLVLIRQRLFQIGDLKENNQLPVLDATLEKAIKRFQLRHGLNDDGVAGKSFFEALNVPVDARIEQLIVNMERCRWMPVSMNKDYFLINIPEFRFYAFENNKPVWNMKVVVGKSIHETAVFSGTLRYVVFAPYWNVPPGILKDEVLPAISRSKNYLAKNHMEWYGGTVRQLPGPWNALGKVKFLFPNSHNIYLHDTPAKELFKRDQRSFSHGCIRVEEPKRLAEYVLRDQQEWTSERIDSAMNGAKEIQITLKKTFPVLIAYFTAWVDEGGQLNFRKDIYNKDHRLAELIYEQ